jgi:type IV pilus assembly protein PilQ
MEKPMKKNTPILLQFNFLVTFFLMLSYGNLQAEEGTVVETTVLEDISFSSLPGNKTKVRLDFSTTAPEPGTFTIDSPARIALDFPGVSIGLKKRKQNIGIGMARSVMAIESGGRTRVVLNMIALTPYTIDKEGNSLTITVEGGSGISKTSGKTAIRDIDFRRGEDGEGRIVIRFSNKVANVDLREEAGDIIVDFLNVNLPEKLEQRLDVIDFATPVQTIGTVSKGRNVRMTIISKGEYDHLAYQTAGQFIIEIKSLTKEQKEALKKKKIGFTGEQLSLNFQDIEVRAVLQLIADFTGKNMVTSDTVRGSVTLRLKNVPWDQALDIILKTKGLGMREDGNVIRVAPADEIAALEKAELEAQKSIAELIPLTTELIQLNYSTAIEVVTLLKAAQASFNSDDLGAEGGGEVVATVLSSRGSVLADKRTNTILIHDTPDSIENVRKLISKLDIPVRQVLIESRIVIAGDDFSRELGVRFGITRDTDVTGEGGVTVTGGLGGIKQLVNNEALDGNVTDGGLNVDLGVTNLASNAGQIALAYTKLPFGTLLELELSAAQAEGRSETISSPRVITSDQQKATIKQGFEIPYQEATSSGATSTSFKEAVLELNVTPHVTLQLMLSSLLIKIASF